MPKVTPKEQQKWIDGEIPRGTIVVDLPDDFEISDIDDTSTEEEEE